jgi:hypothetical protein
MDREDGGFGGKQWRVTAKAVGGSKWWQKVVAGDGSGWRHVGRLLLQWQSVADVPAATYNII